MSLVKNTLITLLAILTYIMPAAAKELKLANFLPPTHPYEKMVFAPFAEKVAAATDGAITVKIYSGGELGPGPAQQVSRAMDGVADIAFSLPGYTASSFPMTLLTEVPGVVDPNSGTATVLANLEPLKKQEYRRVKLVGLWTNAPNALLMREKQIRTLEDLKGLKIRVPSRNAGLVIESWGATPVSMPVPEVYNAMQTGIIDGSFIDGTTLSAFKLAEVTKHITTGMKSSISPIFMVMNRDSYDSLSPDQQLAVENAGKDVSLIANSIMINGSAKGLETFDKVEGKSVIELSSEEAAKFDAASSQVLDIVLAEAEASGIPAREYVTLLQGN